MDRVHRPFSLWLRLTASLLGIGLVGWFIWSHPPAPTTTNPTAPRPDFVWGSSIIPYPTGPANPATLTKVMELSRDLGLRVVRTEITPGLNTTEKKIAYLDPIVAEARKHHLDVMLIIHWKWEGENEDVFSQPDMETLARNRAETIAKRYKGRVKYYQLGNEIPTTALKGGWSGATTDAYDDERYTKTLAWLKASVAGVHAGDPRAKTLTTANWLQYGFFDRAFADGLTTDILGWDWFDESRDIHTLEENGQPVDLIDELKRFKKPIWFVEAGYSGSTHTEAEQADLNEAFFKDVSSNPAVNGAMVQILVDQVNNLGTRGAGDGIVPLDLTDPSVVNIGQPKPAYYRIQQLIDAVSGLPKR